jgi:3-oxoacyl-[acyl-carrier protein] reductase
LVTGGNRGIGLAIAQAFAKNGDRVAVTHRGSGAPEGLYGVQCDITDPAAVDQAFGTVEAELGPVEVLVANAGITDDTLLLRMSEESWARVLETNLTGSWRCAKRAASKMLRARWGRMIFISSVVGLYGGPGQVNYAASKAGLHGLSRTVAQEYGSRGIRSVVVAPGLLDTGLGNKVPPAIHREKAARSLLGLGDATSVAATIAFLAGPEADYINADVVRSDGGIVY